MRTPCWRGTGGGRCTRAHPQASSPSQAVRRRGLVPLRPSFWSGGPRTRFGTATTARLIISADCLCGGHRMCEKHASMGLPASVPPNQRWVNTKKDSYISAAGPPCLDAPCVHGSLQSATPLLGALASSRGTQYMPSPLPDGLHTPNVALRWTRMRRMRQRAQPGLAFLHAGCSMRCMSGEGVPFTKAPCWARSYYSGTCIVGCRWRLARLVETWSHTGVLNTSHASHASHGAARTNKARAPLAVCS